jgi:hypothetical protein
MCRTLLLLTLLYSIASATDPSLPSIRNFTCDPCARPLEWTSIELPLNSPLCYEVGQKMFNWPSGQNCTLPEQVRGLFLKMKSDGVVTAIREFCINYMPIYVYEYDCKNNKGGGKNVIVFKHPKVS